MDWLIILLVILAVIVWYVTRGEIEDMEGVELVDDKSEEEVVDQNPDEDQQEAEENNEKKEVN